MHIPSASPDDMDYGATAVLPFESFQIMHDPEMMEGCGLADMERIVNGVRGNRSLEGVVLYKYCQYRNSPVLVPDGCGAATGK